MSEELKAILDDIEDYSKNEYLPPCCELTSRDCKILLDFIKSLYRYTPEKGFELVGNDND